jgi:hypothetical protein
LSLSQPLLPHQRPTFAKANHEIRIAIHKDDFNFIPKFFFETMGGCNTAKPAAEN